MSALVRTMVASSLFSRTSFFMSAMLATVSAKPSHTDTVQLAAVKPPTRMSSRMDLSHLAIIRPSMITES